MTFQIFGTYHLTEGFPPSALQASPCPAPARLQPADRAWLLMIASGVVFELASKDLLSDSAERLCTKHPILGRVVILALAGHLALVLPPCIDLFNAKNVVHRGIAFGVRWLRGGIR